MTLMQQLARAGQAVEPGWNDGDVERVWQGLRRKRRRRALAAGAVSMAGLAFGAILVLTNARSVVAPIVGSSLPSSAVDKVLIEKQSPPAVARTLRLADGSTITAWGASAEASAGDGSFAIVEDSPLQVVVDLAKAGARFDVVRRPQRVFRVQAGDVTVSVLGTAFSVERVADRVGVAVTRGAVLVDWRVGSRRLGAGEEGWFPPLVVAPPATAKTAAKEPGRRRRDVERRGFGASRTIAQSNAPAPTGEPAVAATPHLPGATPAPLATTSVTASPSTAVESGLPVAAPRDEKFVPAREETSAATLLTDADRARLAGQFEEGAALLRRLVREHPTDQRAPLAAFSLGRVLLGELGRPAEAARAFARARALAPEGPLAEDALAREAEAWARAGDAGRARARGAEYARTYPSGRRAADVNDAVNRTTRPTR